SEPRPPVDHWTLVQRRLESCSAAAGTHRKSLSVGAVWLLPTGRHSRANGSGSTTPVTDAALRPHLGAVDHRAALAGGHAFRGAAAALRVGIRNEVLHRAVACAADPNAALPAGMREIEPLVLAVARLGVGNEQVVVGVDVDAARPAE